MVAQGAEGGGPLDGLVPPVREARQVRGQTDRGACSVQGDRGVPVDRQVLGVDVEGGRDVVGVACRQVRCGEDMLEAGIARLGRAAPPLRRSARTPRCSAGPLQHRGPGDGQRPSRPRSSLPPGPERAASRRASPGCPGGSALGSSASPKFGAAIDAGLGGSSFGSCCHSHADDNPTVRFPKRCPSIATYRPTATPGGGHNRCAGGPSVATDRASASGGPQRPFTPVGRCGHLYRQVSPGDTTAPWAPEGSASRSPQPPPRHTRCPGHLASPPAPGSPPRDMPPGSLRVGQLVVPRWCRPSRGASRQRSRSVLSGAVRHPGRLVTEPSSDHDNPPLPQLLTMAQVAEHLAVPERMVRRLQAERRLGFVKIGRYVRFRQEDVDRYLGDQAFTPPTPRDGPSTPVRSSPAGPRTPTRRHR